MEGVGMTGLGEDAADETEKSIALAVRDVEVEDALFEQGASLEIVEEWALREERTKAADGRGQPLRPDLRGPAVAFVAWLAQAMQVPSAGFFSAVALVDEYSRRAEGGLRVEQLPRVCAAAINLEKKKDSSRPAGQVSQLAACATQFSLFLRQLGHDASEKVTEEQLAMEEWLLLKSMEWQISAPTLESWLALFVQRFNAFTQGKYSQQLNRALQRSLLCARALVNHSAPSPELPHRTLAQGLLCLALAGEAVLPMEAVRDGASSSQDCHPSAQQRERDVQAALCVAAHASWSEMRSSGELAATAMQDATLASQGKVDGAAWTAPRPRFGGA